MRLWKLPLHEKPELVHLGLSVHGTWPTENYRLLGIWCLHFYSYHARLCIDDEEHLISPGDVSICPPGHRMAYHFQGRSPHLFVHFRWKSCRCGVPTPPVQSLGRQRFRELESGMESAIGWFRTRPDRANVRLWDTLWGLSGSDPVPGEKPEHPALLKAAEIIDLRLAGVIDIRSLAREVGLSHGHLLRLFHNRYGVPIGTYIRHRRMDRARYLLTHTTSAVKAVAVECGIPDLHLFNKTVRRELGVAPRRFRSRAAAL